MVYFFNIIYKRNFKPEENGSYMLQKSIYSKIGALTFTMNPLKIDKLRNLGFMSVTLGFTCLIFQNIIMPLNCT